MGEQVRDGSAPFFLITFLLCEFFMEGAVKAIYSTNGLTLYVSSANVDTFDGLGLRGRGTSWAQR